MLLFFRNGIKERLGRKQICKIHRGKKITLKLGSLEDLFSVPSIQQTFCFVSTYLGPSTWMVVADLRNHIKINIHPVYVIRGGIQYKEIS